MFYLGKPIGPCATEYLSRKTGHKYIVETLDDGELTITGVDRALLIFTASGSRDNAMNLIEVADQSAGINTG